MHPQRFAKHFERPNHEIARPHAVLHENSGSAPTVNGVAGFNRYGWCSQLVDATLYLERQDGVSDDGSTISSRVYGDREDGVMGSLAARGIAESDWAGVGKPSSSIYFQVAPHGGIRPAPRRRS